MSIEAMKQALEALEKCAVMIDGEWGSCRSLVEMDETDCLPQGVRGPIIALRIAIAAAEKQEPAAAELRQQHAEIERLKKFCDDLICELSGLRWAASMQKRIGAWGGFSCIA